MIILNVVVLFVGFSLILILLGYYSSEVPVVEEECVDVNHVASFIYDACYDAYSKMIFMNVRRSFDSYDLNKIEVSFFDFSEQSYDLADVPFLEGSKSYKFSAEKNPGSLDVVLNIVKDFSAPICERSREISVKYCPVGISEGANVSIGDADSVSDFEEVADVPRWDSSSTFDLSLVDKERVWSSQCSSQWECGDWEVCEDGVQKRACEDKKDCVVPTDVPDSTRYCDGRCVEEWECEWSSCSGGFTTPRCIDVNSCGTSYNVPKKLECYSAETCSPKIECGAWTGCELDYSFGDLTGGVIGDLGGKRSRVCRDRNSCIEPTKEVEKCALDVDIYTRRISKCGEDYIGIYNKLDGSLVAKLEEGTVSKPRLDIYLDVAESEYCDYCFDGVLNGDESGVDCGGSCMICSDKYKVVDYEREGILSRFGSWLKGLFG